jgi:hypothetical protein
MDYSWYLLLFGVGSLGGFAALLRSTQLLTVRYVLSAVLNSGLAAVAVSGSLVWWWSVEVTLTRPQYALSLCVAIVTGLGGNVVIERVLAEFTGAIKVLVESYASRRNDHKDV